MHYRRVCGTLSFGCVYFTASDYSHPTKTPFTRYNRLSNQLFNRFDNRVERTTVRSTGCQTGLYNRFDNRFDNRLYRVNGA